MQPLNVNGTVYFRGKSGNPSRIAMTTMQRALKIAKHYGTGSFIFFFPICNQIRANAVSEYFLVPVPTASVSNPHTLNADPDPAFLTKADMDPIPDPDLNSG
jgi:hypothetical protein